MRRVGWRSPINAYNCWGIAMYVSFVILLTFSVTGQSSRDVIHQWMTGTRMCRDSALSSSIGSKRRVLLHAILLHILRQSSQCTFPSKLMF